MAERKQFSPWPGISVYRPGPNQFTVLELDIEADEAKQDPKFAQDLLQTLGLRSFLREIRRHRNIPLGGAYYPEYNERGGHATYIRKVPGWLDLPIDRGFDFGWHNPACVWSQTDSDGRVVVLLEWKPSGIRTQAFADVVRFLSGQVPVESLDQEALVHLNRLIQDNRYPPPPWIPHDLGLPFRDWSGTEANQRDPGRESGEATDADIFAGRGIFLMPSYHHLNVRERVIRELLVVRKDGLPGIILSPWVPLLAQGFNGSLSYPKPTPANPYPVLPRADGTYEDLHEALGHTVMNTTEVAGQPPRQELPPVYHGRRRIPQEQVDNEPEHVEAWMKALLGGDQ